MIFGNTQRARVKRRYLQLKTGKKLSEKPLCVLLIHLTVIQLSPQGALQLILFVWNLQCDIWMPIEGYGGKGNNFS